MQPFELSRSAIQGRRDALERLLLGSAGAALVLFLALPLVGLLLATSWRDFTAGLVHPLVWPALRLSLLTTSISLALVVALGTPLAWLLSRAEGPIARAVELLVQLPIVVPPAVAGVAMLLAYGRRSPLTAWWLPEQLSVSFSTAAVVMAQVFVASPFFVQSAVSGFRGIDDELLLVARSFGASPLRVLLKVALPLAAPALLAGAAMSWARALGEFGATLMFAGNLQGRTQTLPLAIYTALETDLRATQALSLVLLASALTLLLVVHAARSGGGKRKELSR
jgi:molybdate transport system permease protein